MADDNGGTTGDNRVIGHRLRRIRNSRRKSLRVVADLAGISAGHLSKIENGLVVLDSRAMTVALANALGVAPQDIIGLPMPAPGNPDVDASISSVRSAVQAVTLGILDGGEVQPVEQLSARVSELLTAKQECRHDEVGAQLPRLILDLHASIDAGRNVRELLHLAVYLHHSGTQAYLQGLGAPADLCWTVARLSSDAAERLDVTVALGVAGFGMANALLGWGSFDLARAVLRARPVGAGDDAQLAGMLTLTQSLLATASGDRSGAEAALQEAAELAERTGEGRDHWMNFGPTNVDAWRLSNALEAGDHARAARLSDGIDPSHITVPTRRANLWLNRARALSRLRGQNEGAVRALRQAEAISADKVHRNPIALDLLAELVVKAKQDAVGQELRAMAFRAGLPV